jgi:hypothetical protein
MKSFWEWVKKWWKWLVAGLVGLFTVFLAVRKDEKTPEFDKAERERLKLEEDIEQRGANLDALREAIRSSIERERLGAVDAARDQLAKSTNGVEEDPKKTNNYLHDADEEMRKPYLKDGVPTPEKR